MKFRFSLNQIFVLTLGVAIGFLPLKLWEFTAGAQPRIVLHCQLVALDKDDDEATRLLNQASNKSQVVADLLKQQRVNVLSQPTLITLNGQNCVLSVGSQIPYQTVNENGVVGTEYVQVGSQLEILPKLKRNGRLQLSVDMSFSHVVPATNGSPASPTSPPKLSTLRATSEAEVAPGEDVLFTSIADADSFSEPGKTVFFLLRAATVRE